MFYKKNQTCSWDSQSGFQNLKVWEKHRREDDTKTLDLGEC